MTGFRLAFALLRIPRLFISLLFFPLLLSIVLMIAQLIGTRVMLNQVTRTPTEMKNQMEMFQQNSLLRKLIYGSGAPLQEIEVCRWERFLDEDGINIDLPPERAECMPDRLDIALHVANPAHFNPEKYVELFRGNFERLHICYSDCRPDLVLYPELKAPRIEVHSLVALLLINHLLFDSPVQEESIEVFEKRYEFLSLLGTQFFFARGYKDPVQLSNISYEVSLLISISSIIIIGLWLAVKAHRKVLDYFAKSGALLPMVAAMGKGEFYGAIWIITFVRVFIFLIATIPSTYILFSSIGEADQWGGMFQKDLGHITLWILALTGTFSLAALVSSLADLKHRIYVFAFTYRYLPLLIAATGGFFWALSFLFGDAGVMIRHTLASLPIVGIVPIIIAPIFQPPLDILTINVLLTLGLIVLLLRANTRWFAAHLEAL